MFEGVDFANGICDSMYGELEVDDVGLPGVGGRCLPVPDSD